MTQGINNLNKKLCGSDIGKRFWVGQTEEEVTGDQRHGDLTQSRIFVGSYVGEQLFLVSSGTSDSLNDDGPQGELTAWRFWLDIDES